jgi:hypothetical protein
MTQFLSTNVKYENVFCLVGSSEISLLANLIIVEQFTKPATILLLIGL